MTKQLHRVRQDSPEAILLSLVYGMKSVLLGEVMIMSMKILMEGKSMFKWCSNKCDLLNLNVNALCHGQLYQEEDGSNFRQESPSRCFSRKRSHVQVWSYIFKPTPGASGGWAMKAHILSRCFSPVVQWLLQSWIMLNFLVLWILMQSRNTLSKIMKRTAW